MLQLRAKTVNHRAVLYSKLIYLVKDPGVCLRINSGPPTGIRWGFVRYLIGVLLLRELI